MSLNALIQPSRRSVTNLNENMQNQGFFVDHSFQRKLVWTVKQKIRLIETILMDYPIPEIYIWEQPANPETGLQRHSIVDGQQRLTTLRQFISNEFSLKINHLDPEHRAENYAGKFWHELDAEDKTRVWQYVFVVRTIPSSVDAEEIRSIFMRLNETDKSLNPQELRHAEFNGEFITAAEEVANLEFWRRWGIFSDSQIRRMADMDFISGLLIYRRQGIVNDTSSSINEAYDLFNDVYEARETDITSIRTFLDFLDRLIQQNPACRDFLTRPNNIYTLFVVYEIKNAQIPSDRLISFITQYNQGSTDALFSKYREGASSRTRSKSNREKRVHALQDWLENRVPISGPPAN